MPDVAVLATLTTKISADSSQPSTLLVGTTSSGVLSYTATFSSDASNPSQIQVGTLADLVAIHSTKFASDVPNSKIVVGTIGTVNSTVNTGMPKVNTSSSGTAILGTILNVSASVPMGQPVSNTGDMTTGTIIKVNATVTGMPVAIQPSVFSRLYLNDSSTTYTAFDATLFMTKGTSGGATSKARFVIDLGAVKRLKSITVTSGVSDALGDQKIKKIVVYSSDTNFVKSDPNFSNSSYTFGENQVGTLTWSTSSSTSQQQIQLVKKI